MSWKQYIASGRSQFVHQALYNATTHEVIIIEYGWGIYIIPHKFNNDYCTTRFLEQLDSPFWTITDISDAEVDLIKLELL